MNKDKRTAIYSKLRELDPSPDTELKYRSPFELLVSVILSAQATDVSVNKATDKLYPTANTPQAIFDLGVDGLKPIGRLTPDALFPESEFPVGQWRARAGVSKTPAVPAEERRWPGHCTSDRSLHP